MERKPPKKSWKQIQREIDVILASSKPPAPLHAFAQSVQEAMRGIGDAPNERFGHQKVFISAVFRKLVKNNAFSGSLDDFKKRLLAARREGLLQLSRADLVGAMPAATVNSSQTSDGMDNVHFVVDPNAKAPW